VAILKRIEQLSSPNTRLGNRKRPSLMFQLRRQIITSHANSFHFLLHTSPQLSLDSIFRRIDSRPATWYAYAV
jgi:hypothetical protein